MHLLIILTPFAGRNTRELEQSRRFNVKAQRNTAINAVINKIYKQTRPLCRKAGY